MRAITVSPSLLRAAFTYQTRRSARRDCRSPVPEPRPPPGSRPSCRAAPRPGIPGTRPGWLPGRPVSVTLPSCLLGALCVLEGPCHHLCPRCQEDLVADVQRCCAEHVTGQSRREQGPQPDGGNSSDPLTGRLRGYLCEPVGEVLVCAGHKMVDG